MSNTLLMEDEDEVESTRAQYREEVLDRYVNAYGDEARQSIAEENNPEFDASSMDEVYSVYHVGENRDGNLVSLESRVGDVEVFDASVSVRGYISDADTGDYAGEFHRVFSSDVNGKVTVTHELLQLEDEYQGTGFAKTFNRQAENYYITHGIETVNVHAALDGGGYAWASSGFDWDRNTRGSISNVADNMDYYLSRNPNIPKAIRTDVEKTRARLVSTPFDSPDYPTPKEIADIGRIDGVNNWPGKEIMRGTNWYGTKTLRPEGARVSNSQAAKETSRANERAARQENDRRAAESAPGRGQLTMDNDFLDASLQRAPAYQTSLIDPIPGMVQ
jgi:hypothetical protein